MPDTTTDTAEGPYARAAGAYWAAGWRGVLPLPARRKKSPPEGYTGAGGIFPSYPDIQAWVDGGHAGGNIALRLPDGILGVDVDHYDTKTGGDTIAHLEERLGRLPATWRTTSRDDGISGIRLYRVPESLRWPGIVGPSVETVRYAHRYAVVWPSVHPDTGGTYRWIDPAGVVTVAIPDADDLPDLPDAWVMHLTGGEAATEQPRANLSNTAAAGWVATCGAGQMCRKMREATLTGLPTLTGGASRHDSAMLLTNRIVWLAGSGHHGGASALDIVKSAFRAAAGDRDEHEFASEWDRLIVGAVQRAAAKYPEGTSDDPCVRPFPADVEAYVAGLERQVPPAGGIAAPPVDTAKADDDVETTIRRNQYAAQELERMRAQRAAQRMLEQEDEADTIADRVRRKILDDKALTEYRRQTMPPAPPFDLGTLTEVLARPADPPMRVDGLIPWCGSALVVAQRKTGKTTLLLNYARAMLTGEPFLGCYDVIPLAADERVAFLNYEVSAAQLARWAHDAGVPADRLVLVNLRGRRNPLGVDDDRAALAATLRDRNVKAVVVDPFGRAYTGLSQNDNSEVQAWLVRLEEFVRTDVGALDLMLAAHAGWDGERSRGASALEDWGDTIITLTKDDEDKRYLRAMGRDVDVYEDEIVMDPNTRALAVTGMGGRKRQRGTADASQLAVFVARAVDADPGCCKADIARAIIGMDDAPSVALGRGKGDTRLKTAIAYAVQQGRVRVEKGGAGLPDQHFSTGYPQTTTTTTAPPPVVVPPTTTTTVLEVVGGGPAPQGSSTLTGGGGRRVHRVVAGEGVIVDLETGEVIQ